MFWGSKMFGIQFVIVAGKRLHGLQQCYHLYHLGAMSSGSREAGDSAIRTGSLMRASTLFLLSFFPSLSQGAHHLVMNW